MEKIISQHLVDMSIPVSRSYCEKLITSHPYYPALLSVSDTFDRLGIEAVFGKAEKDELGEVPFPYLLQLAPNNSYMSIQNQKQLDGLGNGIHRWTGVIIKPENTKSIADKAHNDYRLKERFTRWIAGFSAILLTALFALPFLDSAVGALWPWLITAVTGTVLGVVLILKELGLAGERLNKFCKKGQNIDCDRVLASKGALIFNPIKLTDLVFGYFAFQLIVLSLATLTQGVSQVLPLLAYAGLASLPVLAYSLYYQMSVARKWCMLCLGVSALLLLQVLTSVLAPGLLSFGGWPDLLWVLISCSIFLLTAGGAFLVRSQKLKISDLELANVKATRVAHTPEVFAQMVSRQHSIRDFQFNGPQLILGNPEGKVVITLVASLYCTHCKDAFDQVCEVVQRFPELIRAEIRFGTEDKEPGEERSADEILFEYWLENVQGQEYENTIKLIREWFAVRRVKPFANGRKALSGKYREQAEGMAKDHLDWLSRNYLNKTPLLFFNGRDFPNVYEFNDLLSILNFMEANMLEEIAIREQSPGHLVE